METTLSKSEILNGIKNMPDEVTLDELIDRFIFIEKIKKGLKSAEEGKLKTHDEVKNLVNKWSK